MQYGWRPRAAALLLGVLGAAYALHYFYVHRAKGEVLALGAETTIFEAERDGRRIASAFVEDFPQVYPTADQAAGETIGLWLGNSQLHAINQIEPGDHTAPYYATGDLGWPVYGLSLPNANFQEYLAIATWAIERRQPDLLIVSLVYDDLREDDLRPGFEELNEPGIMQQLAQTEIGQRVAGQLSDSGSDLSSAPNAPESEQSLQSRSEAALESLLTSHWKVWAERTGMVTAVRSRLFKFRNWLFGIKASTKRKMLPVRYQYNMQALEALLQLAQERGVPTLVYIVPLRWDVEPPYELAEYEDWKEESRQLAEKNGATFEDLDHLVPDELWGTTARQIDFMHFQGPGHELLGHEIARQIQALQQQN